MPGSIDAHWHAAFTTARRGGPTFGLPRAIDEGVILGATHLELMAGGGVASAFDPLDVTQYTASELRAGVEAVENWGTSVMMHAFTPRPIPQAWRPGVRSIEHPLTPPEDVTAMRSRAQMGHVRRARLARCARGMTRSARSAGLASACSR